MVLFHNVNVGQRVEVNLGWGNVHGTVQYKGCLTGKQGDWVGVHLDDRGQYLFQYCCTLCALSLSHYKVTLF
jgi:hypothetical protein